MKILLLVELGSFCFAFGSAPSHPTTNSGPKPRYSSATGYNCTSNGGKTNCGQNDRCKSNSTSGNCGTSHNANCYVFNVLG
jgi:hypothetical protein